MIRNLDVAFSFFWQITVQGIAPNVWSVMGALVITASVAVMGIRKWRADEQKARQNTVEVAVPAAANLVRELSDPQPEELIQTEMTRKLSLELEHADAPLHQAPTPQGTTRWYS
jgi:hypothetical protein